jgi:endonuclease/exonuclease/phosphatase family metal-dependent hydrolase
MRLATWNVQKGLNTSTWAAVERLNVDVLTVQEWGSDSKESIEAHEGWSCEWQRGRYEKGLAVLAKSPHEIEEVERSEPCFLSARISGPEGVDFRFVGFWAMSPTDPLKDSYPQQATELIEWLPQDDVPTVLAGDFNASSRNEHHRRNVEALSDRRLISASHLGLKIEQGYEHEQAHATSYHLWRENSPHHMDFLFLPKEWVLEGVEIGTFADYTAGGLSDHVPIVANVVVPTTA